MAQVRIGDETFNVVVEGPDDAPVLMVSNSLGANLSMWDRQAPELAKHFRVVRYDSRGHGQSAAPEGPYSLEQLGRDALAIMDWLGVDKAHWLGLSKGGAVGQWLLVNAPERIERAVLANTGSKFGDPDTWNERMRQLREGGLESMADAIIDRWFTRDFQDKEPETVSAIRQAIVDTPAEGYAACMSALRDVDLREAIRGVKAPVLVIVGDQDPGTPPALGQAIAESIPGAKLVTLNAAHLSNIEDAEAFTDAVLRFLTQPIAAPQSFPRRRPARKTAKKPVRPAPRAAVQKAAPKKATKKAAKKATKKAVAKKAVKKAAKKTGKKAVAKKAAVRTAPKKSARKATKTPVAKKATKKAAKKTVRSAPKKSVKKAVKKSVRKVAGKPVRKPARKSASKPASKSSETKRK